MIVTFDKLSEPQRSKLIDKARQWRLEHHKEILEMQSKFLKSEHQTRPKIESPTGSTLFHPEKWTAVHWIWFCDHILLPRVKGHP